jgi:hypothetical protein
MTPEQATRLVEIRDRVRAAQDKVKKNTTIENNKLVIALEFESEFNLAEQWLQAVADCNSLLVVIDGTAVPPNVSTKIVAALKAAQSAMRAHADRFGREYLDQRTVAEARAWTLIDEAVEAAEAAELPTPTDWVIVCGTSWYGTDGKFCANEWDARGFPTAQQAKDFAKGMRCLWSVRERIQAKISGSRANTDENSR